MMKSFRLLTISTLCYTTGVFVTGQDGGGSRGTDKTLAPTPGVTRPPAGGESLPPITPFPTEPPVIMITPEPSMVRVCCLFVINDDDND